MIFPSKDVFFGGFVGIAPFNGAKSQNLPKLNGQDS